jgi:hypothetical protein
LCREEADVEADVLEFIDDGDLFMRPKKSAGMVNAYELTRARKWGYLGVSREV